MKAKTLPPHAPTLIESTRAIGYTLEAAIADIVDNSISASASQIDIFYFPIDDSYITILDNGCGMNADELEIAMRYGSQNPNEERDSKDLGRFGLGLKTASLSQCRILTVASKQRSHIEACRWDIDHVNKTNDWSLLIFDSEEEINTIPQIEELRKLKSGTLVVWQNLDRLRIGELNFNRSMGKKMDDVRNHLSLVFHRYITGEPHIKKIQLRMNNLSVPAVDPFLSRGNTQIMSDEIIKINKSTVIVRPYILPHISSLKNDEIEMLGGKDGLRKRQGFYVYRNKRLLIWGTWFRMMRQGELSKLARVQVDIPNELDSLWTLDIKKSSAIPPEEVRNNLDSVIQRLAEQSKRTWEFRGKKEIRDSIVHIWERNKSKKGGIYYTINREHPIIEMFTQLSQISKQKTDLLLKSIEETIPYNQLYLDLNSDKPVENQTEVFPKTIEKTLKDLLTQALNDKAKSELLEKLAMAEPFVHYPDIVNKFRSGVS